MKVRINREYQDIAIINIERTGKSKGSNDEDGGKKPNPLFTILFAVLGTVFLLGIGYMAGVRAGYIQQDSMICCDGALELNFEFDFDADA